MEKYMVLFVRFMLWAINDMVLGLVIVVTIIVIITIMIIIEVIVMIIK
jgi:hypothetical protein